MQNMDREPLFYTQIAKQKICQILYFFVFERFLGWNIYQIRGNIHKILQILLF